MLSGALSSLEQYERGSPSAMLSSLWSAGEAEGYWGLPCIRTWVRKAGIWSSEENDDSITILYFKILGCQRSAVQDVRNQIILTSDTDIHVGNIRGGPSLGIDNDRTWGKYFREPTICPPVVNLDSALGSNSGVVVSSWLLAISTACSIVFRSSPHNVRVCMRGILWRKEAKLSAEGSTGHPSRVLPHRTISSS